MRLDLNTYRDKVMGCWMGKNIGGTLGAPFEGRRRIYDLTGYAQEVNQNPPPNDDLDLQLVWLNAVEKYGRRVDARILGEYWMSFIIPDWAEYGAAKANMRMGLVPPLAGHVGNPFKDSCGSFIRSEIWACLAPGLPEIAARYAYEDAIVDHSGEGVYGEVFWAALQSAAFVESDKWKLIDIGLSYIPENCGIARGVKIAIDAYRSGADWKEARKIVMNGVPGTFGVLGQPIVDMETDIAVGEPGWDAPSNIGITILGWLYGEDDFGLSLCTAVNCGEDTDCTGATLGATLGIILGRQALPEEWTAPLGDAINTKCIHNLSATLSIPSTVTELTDRVLRLTPSFLGYPTADILAPGGYTLQVKDSDELFCRKDDLYSTRVYNYGLPKNPTKLGDIVARAPYAVLYDFVAFSAILDYKEDPFFRPGEPRTVRVRLETSDFLNHPQWLELKWHLPEGVSLAENRSCSVFLPTYNMGDTELEFTFATDEFHGDRLEALLDITSRGRHSRGTVPVLLLKGTSTF